MPDSPATIVRQAAAEFARRSQDPHRTRTERDQYHALAEVFGRLAAEMAFGGAREIHIEGGRIVVDSEGHDRPEWADYTTAARAWLLPTPKEVP